MNDYIGRPYSEASGTRPLEEVIRLIAPRARFGRGFFTRPHNDCCEGYVSLNPTSEQYMAYYKVAHKDEIEAMERWAREPDNW
jgi:hypothetical protein